MNTIEYQIMFETEESHWWYVGTRELLLQSIERLRGGRENVSLLDAGCGTGMTLAACGLSEAYGIELSPEAFRFLRRRALGNLARGRIEFLPYPDDTFDLAVSADVICCVEPPGDGAALREIGRVLKPGGSVVLNLPAHESLRGHHDAAVHIRTRYTRTRLRALLAEAGLEQVVLTYRMTLLTPLVAPVRWFQRTFHPTPREPRSDLKPVPGLLNRALTLPPRLENRLIRAGVRFPFGLSVFCIARKPGPASEPRVPSPHSRVAMSPVPESTSHPKD